jgi:hypothetical protein
MKIAAKRRIMKIKILLSNFVMILLSTIVFLLMLFAIIIISYYKYYEHFRFSKQLSILQDKYKYIDLEIKEVPENVKNVILKINQNKLSLLVSRNLIIDTKFYYRGMMDWHISNMIWESLIKKYFKVDEILKIYCYYLYFGNDLKGIDKGSNFLFNKKLEELNNYEIVKLIVYSENPRLFKNNKLLFDNKIQKYLERL